MRGAARQAATGAVVTVVSGFAISVAAPHYGTALMVLTRVFTYPWSYACFAGAWLGVSAFRRGAWRLSHSNSYESGWITLARLLIGTAVVGVAGYGLYLIARG